MCRAAILLPENGRRYGSRVRDTAGKLLQASVQERCSTLRGVLRLCCGVMVTAGLQQRFFGVAGLVAGVFNLYYCGLKVAWNADGCKCMVVGGMDCGAGV